MCPVGVVVRRYRDLLSLLLLYLLFLAAASLLFFFFLTFFVLVRRKRRRRKKKKNAKSRYITLRGAYENCAITTNLYTQSIANQP